MTNLDLFVMDNKVVILVNVVLRLNILKINVALIAVAEIVKQNRD